MIHPMLFDNQRDKNKLLCRPPNLGYLKGHIDWLKPFLLVNPVDSVLPHHHGDVVVADFDGW